MSLHKHQALHLFGRQFGSRCSEVAVKGSSSEAVTQVCPLV